MFKIVKDEIDVEALAKMVRKDEDGAVVTFAGVVRNNSLGKGVRYLDYQAYEEMAETKMKQIADEIKEKWGIKDLAIVHRIGRLEIGEASVAIAVASPHRREAFQACEYAIDRLKEIVPIWKKEVWEKGEGWIEGEDVVPSWSSETASWSSETASS